MAQATATTTRAPSAPTNPYAPADWNAHQADLERRRAEQEKKRPLLRRCLDPEEAQVVESAKPRFRYKVTATFDQRNPKGKMESVTKTANVTAQNDNTAFAIFCDRIQHWPGRKACAELTIERLEQLGNISPE
jgi:hypothetical protein